MDLEKLNYLLSLNTGFHISIVFIDDIRELKGIDNIVIEEDISRLIKLLKENNNVVLHNDYEGINEFMFNLVYNYRTVLWRINKGNLLLAMNYIQYNELCARNKNIVDIIEFIFDLRKNNRKKQSL